MQRSQWRRVAKSAEHETEGPHAAAGGRGEWHCNRLGRCVRRDRFVGLYHQRRAPLSVIFGESPNPATEAAASAQTLVSYHRAGLSGWPFIAACVGWTARASNPYLGPWNKPTAAPVLVVGDVFDPATAYPSSVRMSQELANARLLTVNGFGHTELLNPSACAQAFIADSIIN